MKYTKNKKHKIKSKAKNNKNTIKKQTKSMGMHRSVGCYWNWRRTTCSSQHGRRVYGRLFFSGTRPDYYSWGQSSGINAGVMLLHPNTEIIEQMLSEATYMFLCMRITRRPLRGLLQDFVWHSFRSCRIKFSTFIRSINNKICDALELFKCSGINSKHS